MAAQPHADLGARAHDARGTRRPGIVGSDLRQPRRMACDGGRRGGLLVVKSCPVPEEMGSQAIALAAAGIVDPRFPEFVAAASFAWRVVSGP